MILVVDDHVDTARALAHLLSRDGFEARCVSNGADALTLLRTSHPDVIILDHHMPDMSGVDVLRAIRSDPTYPAVPVIFYSADPLAEYQSEARALGAAAWITKGNTNWSDLVAQISKVIHHPPPA